MGACSRTIKLQQYYVINVFYTFTSTKSSRSTYISMINPIQKYFHLLTCYIDRFILFTFYVDNIINYLYITIFQWNVLHIWNVVMLHSNSHRESLGCLDLSAPRSRRRAQLYVCTYTANGAHISIYNLCSISTFTSVTLNINKQQKVYLTRLWQIDNDSI